MNSSSIFIHANITQTISVHKLTLKMPKRDAGSELNHDNWEVRWGYIGRKEWIKGDKKKDIKKEKRGDGEERIWQLGGKRRRTLKTMQYFLQDEEEPEEAGEFKKASEDAMKV